MNKKLNKADLIEDNFFRQVFQKHEAIMLLIEPVSGKIIDANTAAAKFYGYSVKKLCTMLIEDINTLSSKEILEERTKAIKEERNYFIFPHKLSSGEIKTVEVHSSPIIYQGNKILFSIIHPITDIKSNESKFRGIYDYSPNCIVLVNLDNRFIDVNKAAIDLFGYSKEEFLNNTVMDITYKDDINNSVDAIQKMVKDKKKNVHLEKRYIKKNGTVFWASLYSSIFKDENSKQLYFIAHIKDISERKKAEQLLKESEKKYRTIVSSANEGILLQDKNGILLNWNKEAERIFDVRESEIVGKTPYVRNWHLINEDGSECPTEMHPSQITFVTGKPIKNKILGVPQADKSIKWISVNTGPIFNEESAKPDLVVITISDITERKLAEDILRKNESVLKKLNAEKDKFFSIIAHDLRSPFNGFLGYTEILSDGIDKLTIDELNKISKNLYNSSRNLYELLENLLKWSLAKHGSIEYNPQELSIKRIVNNSLDALRDFAGKKEINLKIKIPENLSIFVDDEMFDTIFRNLITNAIKFSNRKSEIIISSEKYEKNYCKISVKDNGIGMNEDLRRDLFELSANTKRIGTDGESSTGLGLLLCKEFVAINKGELWVESEEGKGSTFSFTVPLYS